MKKYWLVLLVCGLILTGCGNGTLNGKSANPSANEEPGNGTLTEETANTEPTGKIEAAESKPPETQENRDEKQEITLENANVGDYVTFGRYEQDNDMANGKEAVEWLVLDKQGDRLLLISRYGLDRKMFHETHASVTWESCTLRAWLNDTFLKTAFSDEEQGQILQTTVSADPNPKYDTNPGNETTDMVFLLSIPEAEKYFSSDPARQCKATAYAQAQGVSIRDDACWWWLRSPGDSQAYAAHILIGGMVLCEGCYICATGEAVRPTIWITTKS